MQKKSIKEFIEATTPRLEFLYGENQAPLILDVIVSLLQSHIAVTRVLRTERWDQHDVILITYGDSLRMTDKTPLQT